jgi:hypothetical protein
VITGRNVAEPPPRFEIEHLADGRVAIRDNAVGRTFFTTGLRDAEDDVRYLAECAARGDEEEIATHLTHNAATAERIFGQMREAAPELEGSAADETSALAALAEAWREATAADEAGSSAGRARVAAETTRRDLAAAAQDLALATARVEAALPSLFADPPGAGQALSQRIAAVGWERVIEEARSNPAAIAPVGVVSRFGPASSARATEMGGAILAHALADARARTETLLRCESAAAAAVNAGDTPRGELAAALDAHIRSLAEIEQRRPQPDALRTLEAEVRTRLARLPSDARAGVLSIVPQARALATTRSSGPEL